MKPMEVREKIISGELTDPQEIEALFKQTHKSTHPMPVKAIPQMADRQMLANYRPDLASNLANVDSIHFFKRELLEENVRHAVGLFCYGLIGLVDGVVDSAFYGLSEIGEDFSFGVTRMIYRFKDGVQRGKQ